MDKYLVRIISHPTVCFKHMSLDRFTSVAGFNNIFKWNRYQKILNYIQDTSYVRYEMQTDETFINVGFPCYVAI